MLYIVNHGLQERSEIENVFTYICVGAIIVAQDIGHIHSRIRDIVYTFSAAVKIFKDGGRETANREHTFICKTWPVYMTKRQVIIANKLRKN